MPDKRDYYEILGVDKTATAAELKKNYRKLAMKYHPDQNPNDRDAEAKFKELTEAYQVLSDPDRRRRYDQFGHSGGPGGSGFSGVDFDMDLGSMTDFFESIFGSMFNTSGPRRGRRRRGADLQYDLTLTLEQVCKGTELRITIPRTVRCDSCRGSGARAGSPPKPCGRCGGVGQIRLQQGIFMMTSPCPSCSGKGTVIEEPCPDCHAGLVEKEQEFEISIPAGVDDGSVKVIPGGGEFGPDGAPPGDLHVLIHVEKHPVFERENDDLICVQTISWPLAVLGGEIPIQTMYGEVKMKIRPGTKAGQQYLLRGKGIPHLRGGGQGDQRVRIDIDVPKKITPKQQAMVEALGRELGITVTARHPSFLDKVKSLFE